MLSCYTGVYRLFSVKYVIQKYIFDPGQSAPARSVITMIRQFDVPGHLCQGALSDDLAIHGHAETIGLLYHSCFCVVHRQHPVAYASAIEFPACPHCVIATRPSSSVTSIHLKTPRNRQEYSDDDGVAARLGIHSSNWSLYGVVWASGEMLARPMLDYEIEGKRIL